MSTGRGASTYLLVCCAAVFALSLVVTVGLSAGMLRVLYPHDPAYEAARAHPLRAAAARTEVVDATGDVLAAAGVRTSEATVGRDQCGSNNGFSPLRDVVSSLLLVPDDAAVDDAAVDESAAVAALGDRLMRALSPRNGWTTVTGPVAQSALAAARVHDRPVMRRGDVTAIVDTFTDGTGSSRAGAQLEISTQCRIPFSSVPELNRTDIDDVTGAVNARVR
ncbi:hypothetical protein GCM10027169_08810 [Gordonia jinhuaensis]|uniref:hypothetical protein n=1 Tax=Gordonia jinhuaensis TaxID=1517702 RepID=UPI0016645753|nr:hypothetical protein [Gordonia jinhuaensis]